MPRSETNEAEVKLIETGLGKKIVIVLVILAMVMVSLYVVWRLGGMRKEKAPPEVLKVPKETRSINLFYASREADRLLSEAREIAVEEGLENQIKAAITELIKGPESRGKVSSIPQGTEILQVFWEEESQTV
ncbi:MAG: GerMN domain-containing protein, partial [Candidatus Krumholzibacteria bacterium]|nr:GerMN domain-containing protein [Candidatus Krumholzibacteria bacterium]